MSGENISQSHIVSPLIDFLMRLKKIERAGMTGRDLMLLYAVISKPGINGQHLANSINIGNRSAIDANIARLIKLGYVEDRRVLVQKATPQVLVPTELGHLTWEAIRP